MSTYDLADEMERMREDNAQLERERDRLVAERARFEFTDTINADLTEQVRLLHGRITELVAERDRLIQWTTDAASALHAARVIGEREGTHLNYANIDRLLEALTKTTEEQG
jgi:hypothetical protein